MIDVSVGIFTFLINISEGTLKLFFNIVLDSIAPDFLTMAEWFVVLVVLSDFMLILLNLSCSYNRQTNQQILLTIVLMHMHNYNHHV